MKVKSKQLLFSSLPSAKKQKKLMKAQSGKRLGETGMSPLDLQTLPNNYFNELNKVIKPDTPLEPGNMNAFDNIQGIQGFTPTGPNRVDPITWDPLSGNTPKRPTTPQAQAQQRPPLRKEMFNPGQAAVLGLAAFDAALPDWYPKQQVVQPQMGYNPNLYGTGSQAIAQAGGQVGYNPDTLQRYHSTKRKTNSPIYTDNPNDPRIQKYRDSLSLHNAAENMQRDVYRHKAPISSEEFERIGDKHNTSAYGAYRRLGQPDPLGYSVVPGAEKDENMKIVHYAPPVQPIEYRARRPVVSSDVQGISPFEGRANVQATGLRPADLSQKPTKYSVTIRDENAPSKQRSVYFKDKKSWRDFVDSGAVSASSTSETDDSATAAAYRTMESGGSMKKKDVKKRKYQGGGIIPDNMSPFYTGTYQQGGSVNNTGYLDGALTAQNPYNVIPTGDISMQGVSQPINAIPLRGGMPMSGPTTMMPGQDYSFDADSVLEYPMRAGGQLSADKAKEMLRDGTANGKKLTAKQKRYFGMVAAGKAQMGMNVANTDPAAPQLSAQERYYQASAKLGHYKGILNEKLKAKNPQGFTDYFGALTPLRRSGKTAEAQKYVQEAPYEDYLSPEEVQSTLSPEDYNEYLGSLQDVNSYNVQQGQQPLFGTKEGENDLRKLNYGRRFASLQLTPSVGVSNTEGTKKYNRQYNYDPRARQVSFTESGDQSLRPSYLNPATPPIASRASLRKGGVIYDDGGQIGTMWGGNSELASYNPYDGGTVEFQGASHDNGGIGMHYNGQPVEVEGGEYAAQDSAGNLNIFGNMYLPGTRTKFKKVAQEIAKKEKNYDMLKTKGSQYVQESNPANKFERLKFNSGNVMMKGGELGQKDLAQKKESLSGLQKAMLDTAAEFGLDPEKMSAGRVVKARKGKQLKGYQAGGAVNDPTMADRNNNPGNIKWSKFARQMGAKKGPPAADGGNFAVFPSREKGAQAMEKLLTSKSYKDLDVESAITKWTGGHPYNYSLSSLRGKKVGELTPQERQEMMSTMITGEGTRYGPGARPPAAPPTAPPFTPYGLPPVPGFSPDPQRPTPGTVQPPFDPLNPPPDPGPIPSNVEPLHFGQIMGEIFSAATNSVEPVPAQRYEPQLYQPFQVSFQDRLNLNQNSFNALRRGVGAGNPSALGELAAQKYAADTGVKGEEFRTNQAIANDVTNKNVSLLNDAELKNLGIADTQMVRQSTARSKTRATDQMIINSLSSKIEQNKFENKRLAAYENLYDYRFVPQDDGGLRATYYGPNAMFNFSGNNDRGQNPDVKTISRYDAQGNLKGYSEFDDYDLREQQRALDLEMKRRNLPLLQAPPLNKR